MPPALTLGSGLHKTSATNAMTRTTVALPGASSDPLPMTTHAKSSFMANSALNSPEINLTQEYAPSAAAASLIPPPISATPLLHLTVEPTSTIGDLMKQLDLQGVSIPSVTAVIFVNENADQEEDVVDKPVKGQEQMSLEFVVPAAGWVKTVTLSVASSVGAGLMWCFKSYLIVRVKGFFLRQLGEAIGRTIIWAVQRIGQTRQGRIGGLLGRRHQDTGVLERQVF